MQTYRIKRGGARPVSLKERKKLQEAKDMKKLISLGAKMDTTSRDKRVNRIHKQADIMTNSMIEKELAVQGAF